MAKNCIGLIELGCIASGFQVTDAMLKAAEAELVLARSICSDKYMVMVRGDVGAIEASVAAGISAGTFSVIDSFVIPNIHESVFQAIAGTTKVEALEALGVVESFSVASLIEGADDDFKIVYVLFPGNVRGEIGMAYAAAYDKPGKPPRITPEWDVARLYIGAGRLAKIRPSDLVGAIVNEAGVDPRAIGAIQITERFSLVEVPDEIADGIIDTLRGATIKGKRVPVRRDREQGGAG